MQQYINEKHYSLDQVQMLTDHARRESVKRYASVQLDEKRRLMEGKSRVYIFKTFNNFFMEVIL